MTKIKESEIDREDTMDVLCDLYSCELELSFLLNKAKKKQTWKEYGSKSFTDYVENELIMTISRANRLIKWRGWLDTLPAKALEIFVVLGLDVCEMLIDVVNKGNAKEWSRRVNGKNVKEIRNLVKAEK